MGIKKRLCNPIAEKIAKAGDPAVHGAFVGAGRAAPAINDLDLRREFEEKVVACEERYIAARRELADRTKLEMDVIFSDLLKHTGPHAESDKK